MRLFYPKHYIKICYPIRNFATAHGASQRLKWKEILTTNIADECSKPNDNDQIIFHDTGTVGLITLNRPHAANALTLDMSRRIIERILDWELCKQRVIIEGIGEKAFCAGGDLTLVKWSLVADSEYRRRIFFGTLYTLFYIIGTYKIPFIALMNNITMGNGAGLSLHARYKIVTERSIFAMPEASLGFYPDGGCSYVFPRLPGKLGLYLGFTGHRLKGMDILHSGIASHYVPAEKLDDLKRDLLHSSNANTQEIIQSYQPTNLPKEFSLEPYMEKINEYFSAPTVEEIIGRLEEDNSEWARKTLKTLSKVSPTSLKVIHEIYQRGKNLDFADCTKMEFRVSGTFIAEDSDFVRGANALITKNKTIQWCPATLEEVKMEDVLRRFEPLQPNKELPL